MHLVVNPIKYYLQNKIVVISALANHVWLVAWKGGVIWGFLVTGLNPVTSVLQTLCSWAPFHLMTSWASSVLLSSGRWYGRKTGFLTGVGVFSVSGTE